MVALHRAAFDVGVTVHEVSDHVLHRALSDAVDNRTGMGSFGIIRLQRVLLVDVEVDSTCFSSCTAR